jgi:hypothetical protein
VGSSAPYAVFAVVSGVWAATGTSGGSITSASITDSTAAGRALLTGANAGAQRTSLGLGTAATTDATAYATAAQGTDSREWTATTVTQAEAEARTATTRRAFTAERVGQAIAAWWLAISTAAGRALVTAADAAAQRTALGLGTAATAAAGEFATAAQGTLAASALQPTFTHGDIAYAATVSLDLAALTGSYRTISLTGPLELQTTGRAAGRSVALRLVGDGSSRALTFPAGWVFIGASAPTALAAGKTAILSLSFFGAADSDCVAAYGEQP